MELRRSIILDTMNLREAEKALIEVACGACDTMADAAKALGISRHALRRRMARHGLTWERNEGVA